MQTVLTYQGDTIFKINKIKTTFFLNFNFLFFSQSLNRSEGARHRAVPEGHPGAGARHRRRVLGWPRRGVGTGPAVARQNADQPVDGARPAALPR